MTAPNTAVRLPDPEEQPTMTVDEARAFLRLSREAAYKAAASGQLPVVRIGRRVLVSTAGLRRMLALDEPKPAA